ncbi:MAG: hypothetical protein KDA41_13110 [Planctomycetales bacterium]|nr:hypothetical protein [Planctomycetales bacterium]
MRELPPLFWFWNWRWAAARANSSKPLRVLAPPCICEKNADASPLSAPTNAPAARLSRTNRSLPLAWPAPACACCTILPGEPWKLLPEEPTPCPNEREPNRPLLEVPDELP